MRRQPKVYQITVGAGSTYAGANRHSFDRALSYCQVDNQSGSQANVRLNDDSTATFTLAAHTTQIFNSGDISIYAIDFANVASGATNQAIQVIVGL